MATMLFNNVEIIKQIAFLLVCGLLLRVVLQVIGQRWAMTFPQTMTFLLLPIVTYAITSVISDNIALSLGMVGALSIVRFRNPVRSPFELSVYFLLISLGICASVSLKVAIVLAVSSLALMLGVGLLAKLLRLIWNVEIFRQSFSEANEMHTLEVAASQALPLLLERKDLVSYSRHGDVYTFRFASSNREQLTSFCASLAEWDQVTHFDFQSN